MTKKDLGTKEPLIEKLAYSCDVNMIYGPPKTGVTTFLLNLAASAIAGKDFLGFRVYRPLRVGYWNFKDAPPYIEAIINRLSKTFPGFKRKLVYRLEHKPKLSDPNGEIMVWKMINDNNLNILILDDLESFSGDWNIYSNNDVKLIISHLRNIANHTNCAIIFANKTESGYPEDE